MIQKSKLKLVPRVPQPPIVIPSTRGPSNELGPPVESMQGKERANDAHRRAVDSLLLSQEWNRIVRDGTVYRYTQQPAPEGRASFGGTIAQRGVDAPQALPPEVSHPDVTNIVLAVSDAILALKLPDIYLEDEQTGQTKTDGQQFAAFIRSAMPDCTNLGFFIWRYRMKFEWEGHTRIHFAVDSYWRSRSPEKQNDFPFFNNYP